MCVFVSVFLFRCYLLPDLRHLIMKLQNKYVFKG